MHRTTQAARAAALAIATLTLTACATAAPASSEAPTTPATETETPAPTTAPTAEATTAFETQDGAMRITLPEGWTVDDRSAMGEASEMYNRGPGWLNEVVFLDEDGAMMLRYSEAYGNDYSVCAPDEHDYAIDVEIEPLTAGEMRVNWMTPGTARFRITGLSGPGTDFSSDAPAGSGVAFLSVQVETVPDDPAAMDGCTDLNGHLWTGTRMAYISAVADTPDAEGHPQSRIAFDSPEAAAAWLDGEEAAEIVSVLETLELVDAPVLDAAP